MLMCGLHTDPFQPDHSKTGGAFDRSWQRCCLPGCGDPSDQVRCFADTSGASGWTLVVGRAQARQDQQAAGSHRKPVGPTQIPATARMLPEDPQESVVARETIELAFIVAVQHLPPRQRAVLILRDIEGWPASKAADALDLTVASVTSALQRARVTMREQLPDRRLDWRSPATHELSKDERAVVKSYIAAHERSDLDGLTALLREDLRFAMPPEPGTSVSTAKDAVDGWVSNGLFQHGYDDWRCVATTVNRMPAAALYRRAPDDSTYRLFTIAVLHVVEGRIAELTGFDATDKPWLGLPPTL